MTELIVDIILLVVVILGGRVLLNTFMKTTSSKKKYLSGVGLFGIYTYILITFLDYLHFEVFKEISFQNTVAGILIINFVVLLISIFCFFMRNKRKINELDKMKLKDM